MPELPEVETVRRTLTPLIGDRITAVEVRERRLRQPIEPGFAQRLAGKSIVAIDRRGKYLLFELSSGESMLAHLGMTGSLVLQAGNDPGAPHDHVLFRLASGRRLIFNDPRRFGLLKLGRRDDFLELRRVGRDPLMQPPEVAELRELCRGRKRPIKNVLMDQQLLGGIGNIYASEILFRAGVRPRRRATSLTRVQLERLRAATIAVLEEAVRLGGSSISDYRDADGKPGYFQIEHRVYDRHNQPCRACGTPIRRIILVGRSTFYCPTCQS